MMTAMIHDPATGLLDELPCVLPAAPLAAIGVVNARTASVDTRQWRRWVEHGLTVIEADRVAVRNHTHPFEVWGDAWIELR